MTVTPSDEETAINSMPAKPSIAANVVGVDTHKDLHVAVLLSPLGARLDEITVPATAAGYLQMAGWALASGPVQAFGVEGTGCYGLGLARFLRDKGHQVVEVNRPDRATRRRRGKSDPIDAEAAARAVLSGTAQTEPKTADGTVEMIRMLKMTKNSAVKAQTQARNQLKALLVTAPEELRHALSGLPARALIERCAAFRGLGDLRSTAPTTTTVAKQALRVLARRVLHLRAEIKEAERQLRHLTTAACPALTDTFGVGPDCAATLLMTAGDNPQRLHSEAAFAALCGANPIPASSGKTNRHRLNRSGDRQANAALHRIVVVRLRYHQPTQAYLTRRLADGKTKTEIIRCLKRYVAREIFSALRPQPASETVQNLPEAA